MTPGTIVMPWVDDVSAVMNLFAPGKWYGDAFTDNMFGYHTPSAKSPLFYPKVEEGTLLPTFCPSDSSQYDVVDITYSEGLNVAWHGFDASKVLFHFGHGLSYTTFSYSEGKLYAETADISRECPDQDADRGSVVL